MSYLIEEGDAANLPLDDKSVDLVFCSPPYEAARTYGIDFKLRGQDWVDWAVKCFLEHLRVCRGLVAWVIEGQTRKFRWSATPALFMADLHRAGVRLRKPPVFHRIGIPGSGGPDWLRNDYEFIVCGTNGGKLPWSDNTVMGHPPKWAPGGEMSNRHADGKRKNSRDKSDTRAARLNQWGHSINSGATVVDESGVVRSEGKRPSHKAWTANRRADGTMEPWDYVPPAKANPGNAIKQAYTSDEVAALLSEAGDTTHHNVGGGVMGDRLCHENEAPFPESLAEFFVRSFCPPGGIVCDPFSGSGTTAAVANKWGQHAIGFDIRASQIELAHRRLAKITFGEALTQPPPESDSNSPSLALDPTDTTLPLEAA